MPARVDHAAYAHAVADFVITHTAADCKDDACNFMAGDEWISLLSPLAFSGMDVGMAYAAVMDIDYNVVGPDRAPLKAEWGQRGIC